MNGARALLQTLVDSGVGVCFANPGTSEMHFVAALDAVPEMRGVLALCEGVASGAADGYGRMAGRPAAALFHLGPGLANGLANLHNARRARTPIVNVVGDHATHHKRFDSPLESDIQSIAHGASGWYRASRWTRDVGSDAADAVAAAIGPPGQVATLVLPADVAWSENGTPVAPRPRPRAAPVSGRIVADVAAVLRSGEPAVLFLGGRALRERELMTAARIAAATGAKLMHEISPARVERGAGLPVVERLPYFAEIAIEKLAPYRHVILVDTPEPVSYFAYQGKPSELAPPGATLHRLAFGADDVAGSLALLADELDARGEPPVAAARRPELPTGPLTAQAAARAIGALLPPNAIVSDETQTAGIFMATAARSGPRHDWSFLTATEGAPRHDWLFLTGGAIGDGLPVAVGAAVACPDRKVLCLQADGSAMYNLQALWTMVREKLDVTTIIFNNSGYATLRFELTRVGDGAGGFKARDLLSLGPASLDFVSLARGMGMPAVRATTAEELVSHLRRALSEPGPCLVEAVIPPIA